MWFWKKKKTNEIIPHEDFKKLPVDVQTHFVKTEDKPTHKVVQEGDDGFATSMALGMIGGMGFGLIGGSMEGAIIGGAMHESNSFNGFGDGSGGGAGAGGDFSSPSIDTPSDIPSSPDPCTIDSSSSDNSSSFDTSSSTDSSSFDSGSSSDSSSSF